MSKSILFSILLNAILATTGSSQTATSKQVPIKVSEFSFSTHEKAQPIIRSFLEVLNKSGGDRAYVIVYSATRENHRSIQKLVARETKAKNLDLARITVLKGTGQTKDIVQLWTVPAGAMEPSPRYGFEIEQSTPARDGDHRGQGIGTGAPGWERRLPQIQPELVEQPITADRPMRMISKPRGAYSAIAHKNKVEGNVSLMVTFLSNGMIGAIETVSGLPDGLTENAITAARGIKFEPEIRNGVPVTIRRLVNINFTIY